MGPLRRTAAWHERARAHLPGGNTRSTVYVQPCPPYLACGTGYRVTDVDGYQLIDLQNNYTALVHGHSHPTITEAGCKALERGASFGMPTPSEVRLAQELSGRMSVAWQWRFTNSGTEAVMYALRTARAFTGRNEIVRFADAYHGGYDSVLDAGGGVSPAAAAEVHTVAQGDTGEFTSLMRDRGRSVAAVLIDLMPNRAGLRRVTGEFAQAVARETRAAGALLVIDEVLTFRLAPGGLQSQYGLRPDLTTLGKVIGGGLPVGAFGGAAEIMAILDPSQAEHISQGGTFTANPVVMEMGLAAMRLLDAAGIARINDLGDRLRRQIHGLGFEVSGTGSLLRIISGARQQETWWRLYRSGVLACSNGLMAVSTAMDEDVIDDAAARIGNALA